MRRHWSFVVCDPKYLYPLVSILVGLGVTAAFVMKNPAHLNRNVSTRVRHRGWKFRERLEESGVGVAG